MTSNPCTIDAERSVAYAAKMMREEDVGLAPIVEGDRLIGMLTDRDIATRVSAEGRNPDQVKVREVASTQLVTVDPQQDLDDALRMMAKHQIRRLPVVDEDGVLIGVVAQADIARRGDDTMTGQLVEEISESGGQMSSFEEGQFPASPLVESQLESPMVTPEPQLAEAQPEQESISKVQSSSRGRRKRAATRKRKTATRKTATRKTAGRKAAATRKRKTATRKTAGRKAAATRKRKTTARSTAKRSTAKRKTAGRKAAATRKRKTATRKTAGRKAAATRKRKTATRKTAGRKAAATRKRKTTARKSTTTRKRSTGAKKRTTARRSTTKRKTAGRKTSTRKTSSRRTTRRK